MTYACLGLLAGMYALQLSSFDSTSDRLGLVLVAVICFLSTRRVFLFVAFCAGMLLFHAAATRLVATRISPAIEGDSIVVTFHVEDFPVRDGSSIRFVARPLDEPGLPARVALHWFEPPVEVHYGDAWRLEVRLRRPRGSHNPGGFDYESWLFRERIATTGYVVNGRRSTLLAAPPASPLQTLRKRFAVRVTALLADRDHAAVLIALVIGSRHLISQQQWDRYARTGTSHLVAISGLHIGLAAAGSYLVALLISGLARLGTNHHRQAVVASLLAAMAYALISGFAIPAQRATLMLVLAGISLLRTRPADVPAIVAAAGVAVAVSDPLATMKAGFMLSFAAVAVLVWVARRRGIGLFSLQLALLAGLLPLTVLLFDRIVFAALPVNLLAVPLFSFVTVPLALLGLLLDGPVQAAGDAVIGVAGWTIEGLDRLLMSVASTDWAAVAVPHPAGVAWLYLLLPLTWIVLPRGWPGRGLAWLAVLALLLHEPRRPAAGCVWIDVLDVGQGLAIGVRTQRHVLLYDSGATFRNGGTAAAAVILPYLSAYGIRSIDRLIVSHADLDHAGGVGAILANLPVGQVLAGEALPGIATVPCRAGQYWSRDAIVFRILHPPLGSDFEGNNRSCVLLIEAGSYRVLFSGDIERAAEHRLVQLQQLPRVTAVVVPHHGSRTSSSAAFIEALRPSLAIVSAAYGNQWGLPKPDIVARWQDAGAQVINTATSGAIELRVCAGAGLDSIRRFRVLNHRIWHE